MLAILLCFARVMEREEEDGRGRISSRRCYYVWTRQGGRQGADSRIPGELELGWTGWRDGVRDLMRARLEHSGCTNKQHVTKPNPHPLLLSRPCPTATMPIGD